MLVKKLVLLVMAVGFLSSTGCCAFWERWCERRHPNCYPPPQTYCAPAPQACPCPPTPAYSSPQAVPVPSAPTGWRCP
ncbi:MAG TPA: hypothetical protein VFE62_02520 [Gemmataceae bacterium]|nr:hypothetical protein [Gemmataceae bacterium]